MFSERHSAQNPPSSSWVTSKTSSLIADNPTRFHSTSQGVAQVFFDLLLVRNVGGNGDDDPFAIEHDGSARIKKVDPPAVPADIAAEFEQFSALDKRARETFNATLKQVNEKVLPEAQGTMSEAKRAFRSASGTLDSS